MLGAAFKGTLSRSITSVSKVANFRDRRTSPFIRQFAALLGPQVPCNELNPRISLVLDSIESFILSDSARFGLNVYQRRRIFLLIQFWPGFRTIGQDGRLG